MASQQAKWREEQVLVICPGSLTTTAQLGCHDLTPPAHRIPTRMFWDDETGQYTPYHTYKRKKASASAGDKDEWEFVEDRDSVKGAIYPIVGGRIVHMTAFLAFLDHVHGLLTNTYHNTPIVLVISPRWTRPDCEIITQYIFEKTKTPALCLLHNAVAAQYGVKWPSLTVIDIGYEKVDVTCIYDYNIVNRGMLGFPCPERHISGGDVFTRKLQSLLKDKRFTYDMAETLKKSPLCEVLPYAGDLPELMELPTDEPTTALGQPAGGALPIAESSRAAELPKPVIALGGDIENGFAEGKESEEGVLDVANIVTSGNTREFLAKREKEKAEKAKSRKQGKGQEAEPAAAKPVRLPNSRRKVVTFHYEELVHEDVEVPISAGAPKADPAAATTGTAAGNTSVPVEGAPTNQEATAAAKSDPEGTATGETNGGSDAAEPATAGASATERRTKRVRHDIEVGLERFLFADRWEINRITDTIYRTIQTVDDLYKRPACWDNLLFVGNGSRLRGLKENIMQTLLARHLVSPSTATIFTSELPSNMATPSGTGSQTPTGSFTGPLPTTSSVNPLLQAATAAATLGVPGSSSGGDGGAGSSSGQQAQGQLTQQQQQHHSHSHGQTPMSIKLAALPTYLAEWTKHGYEEAPFLGALIAGRLIYCIHHQDPQAGEALRSMSMTRVEYNEHGPKLVRSRSVIG
ncbi:hypothetical protein GGS23DRAFT_605773 [Durotheca rogersii]|uniref:uncharacterized protein n=1 Tax=Durotheca rogersii TaxID=419775 RepID=UPI00221E589C|nr:uncharacterized protein GGS23DRAFT_605773 [Durotheca rogersii]KAI5862132.1 hypothetical protein GGS23DRAFT_605773 [Durotheca rogersii]